jgi:hypothetical protein
METAGGVLDRCDDGGHISGEYLSRGANGSGDAVPNRPRATNRANYIHPAVVARRVWHAGVLASENAQMNPLEAPRYE